MPKHYRRRMGPRPVINSFKKVLNFAPASRLSATDIESIITTGTDSVAGGQTSVNDSQVPTGSLVKFFEIQWSLGNTTGGSAFFNAIIQLTHSGQGGLSPVTVGGSPQRNQVFFQTAFQLGNGQNGSRTYRFKIPKKFQRIREGDRWLFTRTGNATYTDAVQVIYKFYR